MKKKISLIILIISFLIFSVIFGDYNIKKSKGELIKQLVLSKSILNNNIKGRNNISSINLIVGKLNRNKLEKLLLKLEAIDTSNSNLSKYKNLLDYLEAKIGLKLLKNSKIGNNIQNIEANQHKLENKEEGSVDMKQDDVIKEEESYYPGIKSIGYISNINGYSNISSVSNGSNSNLFKAGGGIEPNNMRLGAGVSYLKSSDMNFYLSEFQNISFLFSFNDSIYTAPGKNLLVSKYDKFGFRVTNITSGNFTFLPARYGAFPGITHKINFLSDFFGNKNGRQHIKIEAISNIIHVYGTYYNRTNITDFYVNVKGVGTGASKKVGFGETEDNCKTDLLGVKYTLEPCGGISTDIIKSNGDKSIKFKIRASKQIGKDVYFNIYGSNGKNKLQFDGFPRDTLNPKSHEDNGDNYEFRYNINEDLLSTGTYNGNFSIGLNYGNSTIKNWLNLPIKVNVKAGIDESKIDYCKIQDGDVIIYLEPCNLDISFDKKDGNKEFTYSIRNSNGEIYSEWSSFYSDGFPGDSIRIGGLGYYFDEKYLSKGTYLGNKHIVIKNKQGLKLRELRLPIKLTVRDSPGEVDYCSTIIEGVKYTLVPCEISKSITERTGTHDTPNGDFTFKVISSDTTKNIIVGLGKTVGFPRMSIGGIAGGRGVKEVEIKNYFYDQYLDKGKYNGYMEFAIDNKLYLKKMRLKINLDVK